MPAARTRSSQARSRSVRTCRAAIHASGLNQCNAHDDLREHVRETVAPLDVRKLVEQHDPQSLGRPSSASAGIKTAGRRMPHAIGIAAPLLRRNAIRGEIPSSAASDRACASHGASVTRSARRDIHRTARIPATSRARISSAPAIQTANRIADQDIAWLWLATVAAGLLTVASDFAASRLLTGETASTADVERTVL